MSYYPPLTKAALAAKIERLEMDIIRLERRVLFLELTENKNLSNPPKYLEPIDPKDPITCGESK